MVTPKEKAMSYYENSNRTFCPKREIEVLIDIALEEQAKEIFKLFTEHCDNCNMCETCSGEFKKRYFGDLV